MSRLHLISGPRNISTALMYSFGNRPDTAIVDEPFYAAYLDSHPHLDHPGKEEVLNSQSTKFEDVLRDVIYADYTEEHVFFKNMAHHLDGRDLSWISDMNNILLIRSPRRMISSFARVIRNPSMLDIGLQLEFEIMNYMLENDCSFVVIDSEELLKDPCEYLEAVCSALDINFMDEMLNWKPGPRKEDGVWAKYWYSNVHKTSSFNAKPLSAVEIPGHLEGLLEEAEGYYASIKAHSIKIK